MEINIEAVRLGALLSVTVGIIAIFISLLALRRRLTAQGFLSLSERYDRIVSEFPIQAWLMEEDAAHFTEEEQEDITKASFKYFHLCSQEYHMMHHRFIKMKVWKLWEKEIIHNMKRPLIIREWINLRHKFEPYKPFQKFMNDLLPIEHKD